MQKIHSLFYLITLVTLFACNQPQKQPVQETVDYFGGEITLSESRGLYGSLFKVNTTYTISENRIKREQNLGGINSVFDVYAGIIVDLEKDSVILYYADNLQDRHNKHSTTIAEFKSNPSYNSMPNSLPSPVDNTFRLLPEYNRINHTADSLEIKGFSADYTKYQDQIGIFKQEVFDTKEVVIKREMLELLFAEIPNEINFLLKSELKTTITDISNDSIVSSQQTKAIDAFLRDVFQTEAKKKPSNLEKLAKNKWVNLGLEILKFSVDLNLQITSEVSELSTSVIDLLDLSLPSGDFEEIDDIDEFISILPHEGMDDFDD